MRITTTLISLSVLLSSAIYAQDGSSAHDDGIVIRGTKNKSSPSSVDVITLDEKTKQLFTLSDILSDRMGVQIKRYGGTGSYSTVSIRGSNVNQVTIYLDGIPLSDSVFGEVNLESIPIDSIEKIEIYRGSAPLRFGTGNIGGVINLVTIKNKNRNESKVSAAYGSFDTRKLSGYHAHSFTDSFFLISAHRDSSDGNFKFTNDNGTKIDTSDDQSEKRLNNSFTAYGLTAQWGYKNTLYEFIARNDYFSKSQGLPDYTNKVTDTSFSTVRNITDIRLHVTNPDDLPVSIEARSFANIRKTVYEDPKNEISLSTDRSQGNYVSTGITLLGEITLKELLQKFTLLSSPRTERYKSLVESASQGDYTSNQKRNLFDWGIEDEISLFTNRLFITFKYTGSYRKDTFADNNAYSSTQGDLSQNESLHDYSAGAIAHFFDNTVFIKSTVSTQHRIPSFSELFGDRGYIIGNPSLQSEKSLNGDAGIGINLQDMNDTINSLSCEYSFFISEIKNGIILIQNSQKTMKAYNISGARIAGHEISFGSSFFSHLELFTNVTIQYAKDRSDIPYYNGNYLPGRPIYEESFSLKAFNSWGSITYETSYTGSNFRDRANSTPMYLDSRIYHNIIVQYFPFTGMTIAAEAKNITANQTFDVNGYPLPGRVFLGTLSYIF
jgi:outer membrane cobalamin receptor